MIFILQSVFTLLGTIVGYLYCGYQAATSFLVGALLTSANLALLIFIWDRVFRKSQKPAIPIIVILFKYFALAGIVYILVGQKFFDAIWFGFGLGTIVITGIGFSIGNFFEKNEVVVVQTEKEKCESL